MSKTRRAEIVILGAAVLLLVFLARDPLWRVNTNDPYRTLVAPETIEFLPLDYDFADEQLKRTRIISQYGIKEPPAPLRSGAVLWSYTVLACVAVLAAGALAWWWVHPLNSRSSLSPQHDK